MLKCCTEKADWPTFDPAKCENSVFERADGMHNTSIFRLVLRLPETNCKFLCLHANARRSRYTRLMKHGT